MPGLSQATVDRLLVQLAQLPILAARLVGRRGPPLELDVSVGTAAAEVAHPLGAVPTMVLIGPPDVPSTVYMPSPATSKALTLQATAACRVRILVF